MLVSQDILPGQVVGVLSNKADAYGLVRAQQAGITTAVINHKQFASRQDFDLAMQKSLMLGNLMCGGIGRFYAYFNACFCSAL